MNAIIDAPAATPTGQRTSEGVLDQELDFLGQGSLNSGQGYDVYLGRISRNPVVRSHATGRYFMLPWSRIIQLAVEHGVDAT